MKTVVHNPTKGVYPATDDYVHALEIQRPERLLFVSGTMGLDEQGPRRSAGRETFGGGRR